jgi:hypothetical protein
MRRFGMSGNAMRFTCRSPEIAEKWTEFEQEQAGELVEDHQRYRADE